MSEAELREAPFDLADAQLTVARWYTFADRQRLAEYVEAVTQEGLPVAQFEAAVEAVINGDLPGLERLLGEDPELIRARSTRVTPHDPTRTPRRQTALAGQEEVVGLLVERGASSISRTRFMKERL